MEIPIFVAAVAILAALAMRFGYDSREQADSKEETMANQGMRLEMTA